MTMTDQQKIFVSGTKCYNTYRIPSLFVTPKKTVLAFCEGRVDSSSDNGRIDLIGANWSGDYQPVEMWAQEASAR